MIKLKFLDHILANMIKPLIGDDGRHGNELKTIPKLPLFPKIILLYEVHTFCFDQRNYLPNVVEKACTLYGIVP